MVCGPLVCRLDIQYLDMDIHYLLPTHPPKLIKFVSMAAASTERAAVMINLGTSHIITSAAEDNL